MKRLLTIVFSAFLISLLFVKSFQRKDDKQILYAVRKTIDKNTERECVFDPSNCHNTTHRTDIAATNENIKIDLQKPMTNNVPITNFLKDFGKYPKNQYDYDDIEYPVPFNTLYHDITYRYVNFGKRNSNLPSYVLTGHLPQMKDQLSELLVMTGASDNHGHGSFNLMYSVLLADPYASLIYIDLGLSKEFLGYLSDHFETLHQIQVKMKSNGFLAYRRFNYTSFPDWMNLQKTGRQKRGGYAWKVIPMFDAFHEWKGLFSWLDAGDVIIDSISREMTFVRRYGIYVPSSPGDIAKWTHPDMRKFMKENGMVRRVKETDPNCSSGIVYMDYTNRTVQEIMAKHVECAWTQKCIVPKAAVYKNHRFDQASLSMLLNEYRIPKSMDRKHDFFPALRNENGDTKQILTNLIVTIEQEYHIRLTNKRYDVSSMKYKITPLKYARSSEYLIVSLLHTFYTVNSFC